MGFSPGGKDYLKTRRDTVDWQNDWSITESNQLTFGAMSSEETARALSFGTFFDRSARVDNFYAQDRWSSESHAVLLAVGYSDYDAFGSHITWNAEYGYKVTDDLRAVAAVGTAYRAPNATDRYGFGGNPDLEPEASQNAELSLRYKLDRHSFALSAFQNSIDDLVAYDNAASRVRNIAEARIRGYELSYAYSGEDWRAHAEAIYQDPRDRITNQLLLRRAKRTVTAGYAHTLGDFGVGVDAVYSGPRMDFGVPSSITLDSYVLVQLHLRYAFTDHFSVLAQVDNVTNTEYELANGYNTADRSGNVAVRWSLR
jgi:vitamin B12 transporter